MGSHRDEGEESEQSSEDEISDPDSKLPPLGLPRYSLFGGLLFHLVVAILAVSLSTFWSTFPTTNTWLWAGAVTDNSFELRVKGAGELVVGTDPTLAPGTEHLTRQLSAVPTAHKVSVQNLQPSTTYYYGLRGQTLPGKVKTWANGVQPLLKVAFASCAKSYSASPVFDEIANGGYDLFIHTGDLHYDNIDTNEVSRFQKAFAGVHASPTQSNLFRNMPVMYMWDDHDFGPNNAVADSPSAEAALASYRECVPHPPFSGEKPAVYHAYTIGRVRFLALDLHSENIPGTQIMSEEQQQWLVNELNNAGKYAMVVLLLGMPWVAEPKAEKESWRGHAAARELIGNTIAQVHAKGKQGGSAAGGYANIIGIAGDAHMLAFDDGTNTDYSATGGGGFPLIHAAPLHNFGSDKGGPYSHGCFGYKLHNNHQYGSIEITDTGGSGPDAVCVKFQLHRIGGQVLFEQDMCGPLLEKASGAQMDCSLPLLPPLGMALLVISVILLVVEIALVVMTCLQSAEWPKYAAGGILAATIFALLVQFVMLFVTKKKEDVPLNDFTGVFALLCALLLVADLILGYLLFLSKSRDKDGARGYGMDTPRSMNSDLE